MIQSSTSSGWMTGSKFDCCMGGQPATQYSILFVCATKVRLSKQQDEDHERYAAQRYPTHVQSVTYPANTQAKEEAVPAANQDRI
ncbi:hypothetical protein TNCV_1996741 [Trichonephila clavipes]|uniref:Uncharacterized protein n=1 Tax=Trichonephila clavipes TaxID=2585209 RepID=A0A8X6RXU6_TRICX|nr:hypothetical protein TNCV_1996741 [Trichonephila clavipes]